MENQIKAMAAEIENCRVAIDMMKRFGKHLCKKTDLRKHEYAIALAENLADEEAFLKYYNHFDDGGKKIIQKLSLSWGITSEETAYELSNGTRTKLTSDDFWSESIPFSFLISFDSYRVAFILPCNVKKCVRAHLLRFLGEKTEMSAADFTSSDKFFSAEQGLEFFENSISILRVLLDTDFFSRDAGSAILKGTFRKVEKIAHFSLFSDEQFEKYDFSANKYNVISDFYTDKAIERMKNARLTLALKFLSVSIENYNLNNSQQKLQELLQNPPELFRTLLHNFFISQNFKFDEKFLYPQVSVHQRYGSTYANRQAIFHPIFVMIKNSPPINPTYFSHYIQQFYTEEIPTFFATSYDSYLNCYDTRISQNGRIDIYKISDFVSEARYQRYVFESAFNNLFLMLAAVGFFEIVWGNANDCHVNKPLDMQKWMDNFVKYPYGRIKAIRITELGKYAFGITNDLQISGVKSFAPPVFDENEYIIHCEKGDKATQIFLERFCIVISRTLFRVDEKKLLKCYPSTADVRFLFSNLASRAKKPLAVNWVRLENEIIDSFVNLNPEKDWTIFSLERQKSTFLRLIERLSREKICVKMEGLRIAVKNEYYDTFRRRIENEGFKIESVLK